MSYIVETLNGCTKKFVFNFETIDLSTEIKNAMIRKQKTVSFKGFRAGKAPLAMVEQMYGPQMEHEALNQFVQTQFFDAVEKEKVRVVGYPSFENMKYNKGKSASFDAIVEVFPEVTLKDYSSYAFKKDAVTVTDEDIEALKKNFLSSKAEMVEVKETETKLDKGLFAVINFEGEKENGERPDNMKATEYLLEIGNGSFIPGFEEGLCGMKKGEKRTLNLEFPKEYQVPDLQGMKVKFFVELLEIKERKLPEFKDEMVKELGFESTEDFVTKNKASLKIQKEKQSVQKLHQEILDKFVADNKFEVPNALVHQQEDHLKEELRGNLKSQGFSDDMMEEYFHKWHADLHTKSEFQVRSALILDALGKKFNVEVTEQDIAVKYEEMAKTTGMDVEQISKFYNSNAKAKNNISFAIREEKTFEQLGKEIKIS
ncbi:MAG: trigger factor [Bdellovibrionales bacterium GWA2_49_15]|nr:MAG: trigger factor [Bdellovibrionales bacterium GWA2_49_15]HAZ11596.1 trigger factor [Bdellovibrionales bacterium]